MYLCSICIFNLKDILATIIPLIGKRDDYYLINDQFEYKLNITEKKSS